MRPLDIARGCPANQPKRSPVYNNILVMWNSTLCEILPEIVRKKSFEGDTVGGSNEINDSV